MYLLHKLTGVSAILDVKEDNIDKEEQSDGSDDDSGNTAPN